MEEQEVRKIRVKDLVLWTENPRDPIDENATDQDIINRAFDDDLSKWTLTKLAKEMGNHYDLSEIPTVVYHDSKPVVYDGNRRVILAKIKLGYASIPSGIKLTLPSFPEEIPCNVCVKPIALENIYRKHADSGSWLPLERDIFLHKHMGKEKSTFLLLEEATGIISHHPHLNQGFVKEEVFTVENFKDLGFSLSNGRLRSLHSDTEGVAILSDISEKIREKKITTRKHRGAPREVLEDSSLAIITTNMSKKERDANIKFSDVPSADSGRRQQSRRVRGSQIEFLGGKLYLRPGNVSNLYRDIRDLYNFYAGRRESLSSTFPALIRMSLRLLCETAADDRSESLAKYLLGNFPGAKSALDNDTKTTLANQNVDADSIVRLLQTGAHNYTNSSNLEQTLAISVIVGGILTITHGQETTTETT